MMSFLLERVGLSRELAPNGQTRSCFPIFWP